MASKRTAAAKYGEQHAQHEQGAVSKSPLVVVESRRLNPRQINRLRRELKRLRRGRGPLVKRLDEMIEELVVSGMVTAGAQPVVILMRETMPWPFADCDYDDEDEDEDEDDEVD